MEELVCTEGRTYVQDSLLVSLRCKVESVIPNDCPIHRGVPLRLIMIGDAFDAPHEAHLNQLVILPEVKVIFNCSSSFLYRHCVRQVDLCLREGRDH